MIDLKIGCSEYLRINSNIQFNYKKHKRMKSFHKIKYLLVCLIGLLLIRQASAQNWGVLHLKENSYSSYADLNIDLKKDLLATGTQGEATLEFWIRSSKPGNEWTLTDLNSDDQRFRLSMHSESALTLEIGDLSEIISLSGKVEHDRWNHIALVISQNYRKVEVFVDGNLEKTSSIFDFGNLSGTLRLFKHKSQDIYLTELRGWNVKRTQEEVFQNQNASYIPHSADHLLPTDKDNSALKFLYGEKELSTANVFDTYVEVVNQRWGNTKNSDQYVRYVSKLVKNGTEHVIAEVRNDVFHPLFVATPIPVVASDGGYDDYVQLQWPHIDEVDGYNISVDGVQVDVEVTALGNDRIAKVGIGQLLPGAMHNFKVRAYKNADKAYMAIGADAGFVFQNGIISGILKTPSDIPVQQAKVIASTNTPWGSSLFLEKNKTALNLKNGNDDVKVFRNKNAFTVEFWGKHNGGTSGECTLLKIANTEIKLSPNGIKVNKGSLNGESISIDDTDWHHYAIAISNTGVSIFKDKELVKSKSGNFLPNLSQRIFQLNANNTFTDCWVDELRIWDNARTQEDIGKDYQKYLTGEEAGLLLYYRFNMESANTVYNQSRHEDTRGSYHGGCSSCNLKHSDFPPALEYSVFTDADGAYSLKTINYNYRSGTVFQVEAEKEYHDEIWPNPENGTKPYHEVALNAQNYTQTEKSFTDNSQLRISGKMYYVVNGNKYAVPKGKAIQVDGVERINEEETTDEQGDFVSAVAVGAHLVTLANSSIEERVNMGNRSLFFDGEDDYAQSDSPIANGSGKATWSGWLKTKASSNAAQVVMSIGNLKLRLEPNNKMTLYKNGDRLITSSHTVSNDTWTFFAITYDQSNLSLFVGNSSRKTGVGGMNFNGKLILGGYLQGSTLRMPFEGYLDLVEYRDGAYSEEEVGLLRNGKYIAKDTDRLKLQYTFEESDDTQYMLSHTDEGQKHLLRLYNTADTDKQPRTDGKNDYLRTMHYSYNATNEVYQDTEDPMQYRLTVTNPVGELNFENTTRTGLIGNIILPCDCSAGEWEIEIENLDSNFPLIELKADNSDQFFNEDRTAFSVKDLVPGKYQVRIKPEGANTWSFNRELNIGVQWGYIEYTHNNPLQVAAEFKGKGTEPEATFTDESYWCAEQGKYILDMYTPYQLEVRTFEQYNKPPRKNVSGSVEVPIVTNVALQGKMLAGVGGNVFEIGETGQEMFTVYTSGPKFYDPYFKTAQLVASKENSPEIATTSIEAFIEGSVQFNQDFTVKAPQQLLSVLHDPPGDGSSATWNEGNALTFEKSYQYETAGQIGTTVKFGVNVEAYKGGGVGIIALIRDLAIKSHLNLGGVFKWSKTGGNKDVYEVSLDRAISTNGGQLQTGRDADLFIGISEAVIFGRGKSLEVNGCIVEVTEAPVVTSELESFFVQSGENIKGTLVPNLKESIHLYDMTAAYTYQKEQWQKVKEELNSYKNTKFVDVENQNYVDQQAGNIPSIITKINNMVLPKLSELKQEETSIGNSEDGNVRFQRRKEAIETLNVLNQEVFELVNTWKRNRTAAAEETIEFIYNSTYCNSNDYECINQREELRQERLGNVTDFDNIWKSLFDEINNRNNQLLNYQSEIGQWESILAENNDQTTEKWDDLKPFNVENQAGSQVVDKEIIAFGGGGASLSYSLSTSSDDEDHDGGGYGGAQTTEVTLGFNILGAENQVVISNTVGRDNFWNEVESKKINNTFSFTLSDDEPNDNFLVGVKKDNRYGTPIFKTLAGRSSCPYEQYTVPLEGVALEIDEPFKEQDFSTPAVFTLTLTNTQPVNDNTEKEYILALGHEANPHGAIIKVNGKALDKVTYTLQPQQQQGVFDGSNPEDATVTTIPILDGEGTPITGTDGSPVSLNRFQANAIVTVQPGATGVLDYDRIPLYFYSKCEGRTGSSTFNKDELLDDNGNSIVKLIDTVYISVAFRAPCVQNIDMTEPQGDWIVNTQSFNADEDEYLLPIEFKLQGAQVDYLEALQVELATEGGKLEYTFEAQKTDLILLEGTSNGGNLSNGNLYRLNFPVPKRITDGEYQFRIVPKCCATCSGDKWETASPTDWIQGNIARSNPQIIEVAPIPRTFLTGEGDISIEYDRRIKKKDDNVVLNEEISLKGTLANTNYVHTSVEFDHKNDQITLPDLSAVDLGGSYSIEFWIYPYSHANVPIIEKGSNFKIHLKANGRIDNGRGISNVPVLPNEWSHVAVVYNKPSRSIETYINGQVVDAQSNIVNFSVNNSSIKIGRREGSSGFKGMLDEVRIWNKALLKADIIKHYRHLLENNQDKVGLVTYLRLDNQEPGAILDYVGNYAKGQITSGGTLTWETGAAASPVIEETKEQILPIQVLTADRKMIIQPKNITDEELEGASLTAYVAEGAIEDLFGNPAEGRTWSFGVNMSHIYWNETSHEVTQRQGEVAPFTMELTNDYSQVAFYEIVELPFWLRLSGEKVQNTRYTLESESTDAIEFEVGGELDPGEYAVTVKAQTFYADNTPAGTKTFRLRVNVSCSDAPSYVMGENELQEFNENLSHDYRDQMYITARLDIDGEYSEDTQDYIAVYSGDEIRGIGKVQQRSGMHLIEMIVYGNASETEALTYKGWDASHCREHVLSVPSAMEDFSADQSIGTLTDPAAISAGTTVVRTLSLKQGFNWVSFNLKTPSNEHTLEISDAITGFENDETIENKQEEDAIFSQSSGWGGSLTVLDSRQSYMIYVKRDKTVQYSGKPVGINTNIPVGGNSSRWIGYIPERMMSVNTALRSLLNQASNGDKISGQSAFATYQDGKWIGALKYLSPQKGYRLRFSNNAQLNYLGWVDEQKKLSIATMREGATTLQISEPEYFRIEEAAQLGWTVNAHDYPASMHIVGVLSAPQLDTKISYLIGAFTGEECRGVAVPQKIEGKYHYFMVVHGKQAGEEVSFRLINQGETQLLSNTLAFELNGSKGEYTAPYNFKLPENKMAQLHVLDQDQGYALSQNQPNPMGTFTEIQYQLPEHTRVVIAVYDQLGRKVKTLVNAKQNAGVYTITWDGKDDANRSIANGVYYYELKTAHIRLHKKLMKY